MNAQEKEGPESLIDWSDETLKKGQRQMFKEVNHEAVEGCG